MVAVVDHDTIIGVVADHKLARAAAAGFVDAPDALILWQLVLCLGMTQIPDLADIVGYGLWCHGSRPACWCDGGSEMCNQRC